MPDSAPGVADHKPDLGAEIEDIKTRLTNLENAAADRVTVVAGEENPAGGGHTDVAPQVEPAIGAQASS